MTLENIKASIEAILFSLGEAIEYEKIAKIIDMEVETTRKILNDMVDDYSDESRGIKLISIENKYQLCTKKEYYEYVKIATNKVAKFELSNITLETLSIIAYKQPITKSEIEKIRGVKSDHAVNKLVEYGLIEEKGRMDTIGRPILFGTTDAFLRGFGLSSTNDLPKLKEGQLNNIKKEVEKEVQLSFDDLDLLD